MKFRGIALDLFAGDLEFTICKGSSAGRKPGAGWERTNSYSSLSALTHGPTPRSAGPFKS
jgi:hypothetical protein